jgi:hypothetical protein
MSTETAPNLVPTKPVDRSVAGRMRLYRRRLRRGHRYVRVLIGPADEGLVAKGYLPPDKQNDHDASARRSITLCLSTLFAHSLDLVTRRAALRYA